MFFATVSGYYLPLLLTVSLPFVLLFFRPGVANTELTDVRIEIEHFESAPVRDFTADYTVSDFNGTAAAPEVCYPVSDPEPLLFPEQIPLSSVSLLTSSGNKAPPKG